MMTKLKPSIICLASCLIIAGCSSGGIPVTSGPAVNNTNQIFSSINELSYVPPQTEYRIGASDLLDITIFPADGLNQSVRVDSRGYIALQIIKEIKAQGLTQQELARALEQAYSNHPEGLNNPKITVFVKEATSQRVTVEGEVKTPSVYPIAGAMTVLQAVAKAGGPTTLASNDKVVLFRTQPNNSVKAYQINLNAIRSGTLKDPYLQNDDRIVVHRSNSVYWLKEAASFVSPISVLNGLVN
jgi:polysaccharide export outer membrane protein